MPAIDSIFVRFADYPAAESEIAVGGWSARGAALADIGISRKRGVQYEAGADKVPVTAHSTPEEMARALIFANSTRVQRKIIECGRRASYQPFYVCFVYCKYK